MSAVGLAVCVLAAWRATRAVTVDAITQPFREWLVRWSFSERAGHWREWVHDLLTCQHCLGFWLSGLVAAAWAFGDGLGGYQGLVLWWAVAGGQSLLTLLLASERE